MRCTFMFNESLSVAYEKSDEVLSKIKFSYDDIVSTEDVVDYVSKKLNCIILLSECSFKDVSDKIKNYGAMMATELIDGQRKAQIILNSDKDLEFQRFSLLHEIGHLMTNTVDNLFCETSGFVVSTHIDYNITSIPLEDYKSNDFLREEQCANVFALRVLMPGNSFYKRLTEMDSISKVAKHYRLKEDAVISRIMLVS